jgi:hypothetical protein
MRVFEFRLTEAAQRLTDAWKHLPVAPRGEALLGISFRPLQAEAFGLDLTATLQMLLEYPFDLIRLGAYWNRMEPERGSFHADDLDWQIEAAEDAGKKIILCLGPIKTFGYPEFFVPGHHLPQPFREHTRITPSDHPELLDAAIAHIARLVERYGKRDSIVAWQLEHEAVDPLGFEHSWRLDAEWVRGEVEALRRADPTRPIMMNGFLPTTLPVRLSQGWSTRDQGDSLDVARRFADIVGIDYYPRTALASIGSMTLYLDGTESRTQEKELAALRAWAGGSHSLMVSEGQAEPWEAATTPPSPGGRSMYSCPPDLMITNYNRWMRPQWDGPLLYAYLFWGAEYWVRRLHGGDSSYLDAFARVLEDSNQGRADNPAEHESSMDELPRAMRELRSE